MRKSQDGYRSAERVMKGASNHRRIEILALLRERPERSVSGIAEILKIDFRTASDHTRRMEHAGLVMKRSDGVSVRHALTKLGEHMLKFLDTIANE